MGEKCHLEIDSEPPRFIQFIQRRRTKGPSIIRETLRRCIVQAILRDSFLHVGASPPLGAKTSPLVILRPLGTSKVCGCFHEIFQLPRSLAFSLSESSLGVCMPVTGHGYALQMNQGHQMRPTKAMRMFSEAGIVDHPVGCVRSTWHNKEYVSLVGLDPQLSWD